MTRSPAHRASPAILALAALALAGCGSADEPARSSSSTAASTAAAAPSASTSASATPLPAAGSGKDDPLTGITGTQDVGICSWVTGEQVGALAGAPVTGPLMGMISTDDTRDGTGTIRRCSISTSKGEGLILGTITFESRADLEKVFAAPDQGITRVADLPQPATFGVHNTPFGVSQSIHVADGTTVRYITRPGEGDPQAKVVEGKIVPETDHRPALRALYDQLFG